MKEAVATTTYSCLCQRGRVSRLDNRASCAEKTQKSWNRKLSTCPQPRHKSVHFTTLVGAFGTKFAFETSFIGFSIP